MESNEPKTRNGRTPTHAMSDVRLQTARQRLAESAGGDDAIEAVREIVANFLGSEEMGLFQIDDQTRDSQILWSFGIEPEKCELAQAVGEAGLRRLLGGNCHLEYPPAGAPGAGASARAFVPLRFDNRIPAVLAILKTLPQKMGFDKSDLDIIQLLAEEAGTALFRIPAKPAIEKRKG